MKHRLFGVVVTLVLVASLFGFAIPASSADLLWSAQTLPGTTAAAGWTVKAGSDVGPIAVTSDGTLFAGDPTVPTILRSTNGGKTWTAATTYTGAAVVAMVVSPNYAVDKTVIVLDATRAWKSTNGGVNFTQMSAALVGAPVYTSLAISPTFQSDGLLIAGTADPAGAAYGTAWVFGRPATFGWVQWDAAFATDVTSVAFSPNFPVDATVLAVGSNAGGTTLNASVNWGAFGAIIAASGLIGATTVDVGTFGTGIVSSSIALPSDYNAAVPSVRRAYVGVNSSVALENGVWRVTGAAGADVAALLGPGVAIGSIAYSGTYAAGTVIAGNAGGIGTAAQVYRCANPSAAAGWVWLTATKAPTGTTAAAGTAAFVALALDFATSNKVYAGTIGAESAFAVSTDGSNNFYETGLIDTVMNTIVDFQPTRSYATDKTIFMVTEDAGAGPESVWKTTDSGATWVRMLAFVTAANNGIIRLSPSYDTDNTAYFANIGALNIRKTTDGGVTWTPYAYTPTLAVTIAALVIQDPITIYVGGSAGGLAEVKKSTSSGWIWGTAATGLPAATLSSLSRAANGDMLVGVTGNVYRSTDAGVSFAIVGLAGIAGAVAPIATFDAKYETNATIYAGDAGVALPGIGVDVIWGTADDVAAAGAQGVFRFVIGTDAAWAKIDNNLVAACRGLVATADGALYAADASPAAAVPAVPLAAAGYLGQGGVVRSLTPTAAITLVPASFEALSTADGLTAGYTLQGLAVTAGSNLLFSRENSTGAGANRVMTYNDTVGTVAPLLSSPADNAVSGESNAISIAWEAVTGALSYDYATDTRSDFATAAIVNVVAPITNARVTAGIAAGVKYYWRVRVSTPARSPWSLTRSVTTQITGGVNAPAITSPSAGGVGPGGTNAPLTPVFNWGGIMGATGYEFQLAKDAAFKARLVDLTGTTALGAVTAYQLTEPLEYSTTYYWRVRGFTATAKTDWSNVIGFTTMAKPAAPTTPAPPVTPTFTFPTQPTPTYTITVPPATQAPVSEVTPGWIYAIIAIGAILIIAVIVLIVRTRRVV